MRVNFNKEILKENIKMCETFGEVAGVDVAFLIKRQVYTPIIDELFKGKRVYTTADIQAPLSTPYNLYHGNALNNQVWVVDAFERREGITLEECENLSEYEKGTAIVNFYCASKKEPTEEDLHRIYNRLKKIGFKRVSFGGSMFMGYKYNKYDEIRICEAVFTGYSRVHKGSLFDMRNAFSIEVDVIKEYDDCFLIPMGLLQVRGFTNAEVVFCNTDFTLIKNNDKLKFNENNKLVLEPDFVTIMRLVNNGDLQIC